jgi:hypothetical protein
MRPIRITTASGNTSSPIPLDVNVTPFSVSVTCVPTIGNATLQYTSDDIWALGYNPSAGNWQTRSDMTAQATAKDIVITSPVTAIRMIAAGGGSVATQVVQAGN